MAYSKIILNGETLMDVTSDTVDAGNLLSGKTATKNSGAKVTGNIATKSSSDLTVSGATVTVPAGYYSASTNKSVASGTAGTPIATKSAVSNNSVSVTPSVTNTTGYITGSTKTGTAVTVSASELVSGTKSIIANGIGIDVTNYANVDVNVSPTHKATIIQEGTFIYDSGGIKTLNIPYNGNGYPILINIHVSDGMYDTTSDWYNLVAQYKVGQYSFTKGIIDTAPDYDSSVYDINSGLAMVCYKNSASSATSYAFNPYNTTQVFTSSSPSASYVNREVTMQNATQMKLAVGQTKYSFAMNIEYTYHIVYSE